jgi:hypothetical protein
MVRSAARAAAAAVLGAMAGIVCLVVAYAWRAPLVLEMDRDQHPAVLRGVYPAERDGERTFAWTQGRAELALADLNRNAEWVCSLRFRGGRSAGHPQPVVDVAVDGIRVASRTATNEYQDVEVRMPVSSRSGGALTISAEPTIVPGASDPRALGVQVDRLACQPADGAIAIPPGRAIAGAALAIALLAGALALVDIAALSAIAGAIVLAAGQAVLLASGAAPYGPYPTIAVRLAAWIALALVVVAYALKRTAGGPLRNTARFVLAFAAGVLYLKLLGLLHPSKPLVDAVFQAHRLEWVLGGRYFFTQPMPGGVQFPYAIALYVVAAPWTVLTRDYVTLLRVVACVFEAIAGALLYLMVVRARGDRLQGAVGAALFSLVPMAFWYTGNANLTAVFGQSVGCMAVVAATVLPLQRGRHRDVVGLTLIAALAFLSHVSTFAILAATLVALAAAYWTIGGPALRSPSRRIVVATIVAALVAVGLYYGRFGDVYARALRVRAPSAATAAPAPAGRAAGAEPPSLAGRVVEAAKITNQAVGWPLLLLAAVGAWRFARSRIRDRLACAALAWAAAFVVFAGVGVARVEPQFQRYSYEFVGRVALATYPAAAVLGGYGAIWVWRAGAAGRVVSIVVLVAGIAGAVRGWLAWIA